VNKQQTVVLLRWVLIIACSYLLIVDGSASRTTPVHLVLLIVVALASNLLVARLPQRWADGQIFDFAVVVFDAAWVTIGLAWAPNVSEDLFLLYFLVIFVAATGESLRMIVCSAAVVSLVYGATMSLHAGNFHLTPATLLRVPFLFVVALFYGYFVGEIRTRRSETVDARSREDAKTELLASVSHDLRGPLANAENLLALVLEGQGKSAADDRRLLVRAQVNVRRLNSLVHNLLQAACIDSGQLHLQWAPVQLNDVVDDVINSETGAALLKDLTVTTELDAHLPAFTADFMQLGRIVTNLVNNAIKYTAAGGSVVIRTACDADTVRLSVADTGPGMSPEQCSALFAPYRRVHAGGYTPGMGLGLYIVKRLTEAQHGTVSVSSTEGVGSTFAVTFPRTEGETDRAVQAERKMTKLRAAHATSTALGAAPATDLALPDALAS
jgi:signal transduction histidine kinase